MPLNSRTPCLVTIHDTLRFQLPQASPKLLSAYYGIVQRRIARRGVDVIAVSQYDADVMQDRLGFSNDKFHVCPHGGSEAFAELSSEAGAADFLWFGFPYSHKNVPLLIEAFSLVRSRLNHSARLKLVGIPRDQEVQVRQQALRFSVGEFVDVHPPCGHDELTAFFAMTAVVCLPSSYESFGLPVLEGLSCGRSVVTSNHPVFAELFGDHVHAYQQPTALALADSMEKAHSEYVSGTRVEAHRRFAENFTWQRCSQRTSAVYRRILLRKETPIE